MSFNFMAAVTICSDFGAQENKSVTVSIASPSLISTLRNAEERPNLDLKAVVPGPGKGLQGCTI